MVSFSERGVFVVALHGLKVWNKVDKYLWCLAGLFFNTISSTLAIVGQLVLKDLQLATQKLQLILQQLPLAMQEMKCALRELQMALREMKCALRELQVALREL
jgi:hypothetical protein